MSGLSVTHGAPVHEVSQAGEVGVVCAYARRGSGAFEEYAPQVLAITVLLVRIVTRSREMR